MSTTVTYSVAQSDKGESLVVCGTTVRVITNSNPRYNDIKSYLQTQGSNAVFDEVLKMIDAGPEAVNKLVKLSERVTYQNGHLYFDGDEVETALAEHIVRMVKAGDDNFEGYVAFLENLSTNPSKKSRKALFEWLQQRLLTITSDGSFVAYKNVRNGKSINAGGAFVEKDGGQPVWHDGHIPNEIGSTISMPRLSVDDDRNNHCSTGLHAGTREYAQWFGGGREILAVSINPRDVVMVPPDHGSSKLRVCRYTVLDKNDAVLDQTTYGAKHRYSPDAAVQESFTCDDCQDETPINQKRGNLCENCDYYANNYQTEDEDEEEVFYCDSCTDEEVPAEGAQCSKCEEYDELDEQIAELTAQRDAL